MKQIFCLVSPPGGKKIEPGAKPVQECNASAGKRSPKKEEQPSTDRQLPSKHRDDSSQDGRGTQRDCRVAAPTQALAPRVTAWTRRTMGDSQDLGWSRATPSRL